MIFAAITDVIGGRSSVYERRISRARQDALKELEEKAIALGANAVVGVGGTHLLGLDFYRQAVEYQQEFAPR